MNPLERKYLIDVRPRHRETADSYTRRLLTANTDTTDHQNYLIGLVTRSQRAADRARAWLEIMVMKTRRKKLHLDSHSTGWLTHADGTSCEHCAILLPRRWMCTLCTRGEAVQQHPHFDDIVCLRHHRWVGLDALPGDQHQIGDAHVAAALVFRKLRRKHLLDVRLFAALTAAINRDLRAGEDPRPSASFPAAVELARLITGETFSKHFYNPTTSIRDAHRYLQETVHSVLGHAGPATTRAIWLCAHATVFAIRQHLTAGKTLTLTWPHDLPVHPGVVNTFKMPEAGLEPFKKYLATSRDTPVTVAQFAARIGQRTPLKTGTQFIRDKAYEICSNGHQFLAIPAHRLQVREGRKCTVCRGRTVEQGINDLATTHPDIAREFAADENEGRTSEDISANSKTRFKWRCTAKGHVFEATPSNRALGGSSCSVCQNRVIVIGVNDLATTHPELIPELHPSFYGTTIPTTHSATSEKVVTWDCTTCDHEYRMSIYDRTHGHFCPNCTREQRQAAKEGLTATHPEVAAEWHPVFNNCHHPDEYTHGSREEVFWQCQYGHNYKMRIERRTAGYKCKVCSRRGLVPNVNDLATLEPLMSSEWHPYLNRHEPNKIAPGNDKHWWRCLANRHKQQQSVPNRRLSGGCVSCPPEERILNRTTDA